MYKGRWPREREGAKEQRRKMSKDASTAPLLIPYKIGVFDLSHRGFDDVEIHGTRGYLIYQFFKDQVNDDNTAGASDEIRADKVGMRPFASYSSNPESLDLYYHVVEPRMVTFEDKSETLHSFSPMRDAFKGNVYRSWRLWKGEWDTSISSGYADMVACSRLFLSSPDLPRMFEIDAPLSKHNRDTLTFLIQLLDTLTSHFFCQISKWPFYE